MTKRKETTGSLEGGKCKQEFGLKIRSPVSPIGCEVVICWDRKIQIVYLESLLQLLTLCTKSLQN